MFYLSYSVLTTIIAFVNGKAQDKVRAGHGGKYNNTAIYLDYTDESVHDGVEMNKVDKDRAVAKDLQSRPLGTRASLSN